MAADGHLQDTLWKGQRAAQGRDFALPEQPGHPLPDLGQRDRVVLSVCRNVRRSSEHSPPYIVRRSLRNKELALGAIVEVREPL